MKKKKKLEMHIHETGKIKNIKVYRRWLMIIWYRQRLEVKIILKPEKY